MRIVLANPPWWDHGRIGIRAGSRWPHLKDPATEPDYLPFPFFLAHAASLLQSHQKDVHLIDAIAEECSEDAFLRRVEAISPDLFVAEISTPSLEHDLRILKAIKARVPRVRVAVCGSEAQIFEPSFLEAHDALDFTFVGEYEMTLLELVECLEKNEPPDAVQGLIFRKGGKAVTTPARPLLKDLNLLPWPMREGLPMYKYLDAPGGMPLPSLQMWASRGCVFKCTFCQWPQVVYQNQGFRARDTVDVIDEMEYVVKKWGFRSAYFDDDTFNLQPARIFQFCEELERRQRAGRLLIPWAAMARADLMTEKLLYKLKSVGLFAVKYGVESASQELVDNAKKDMDLEKTDRMIRLTHKLGIKTHLTFTFGLPGETRRTVEETTRYAIDLNPTSLQFSIMTPFPGTELYQQAEANQWLSSDDWSRYNGSTSGVLRTEQLSPEDLERAQQDAYRRWGEFKGVCVKQESSKRRSSGLTDKFFIYMRGQGLQRAVTKAVDYTSTVLRQHLGRNGADAKKTGRLFGPSGGAVIAKGDLRLEANGGRVRLFWKDMEVTDGVGLNSSLLSEGRWHDSSQADWHMRRRSDDPAHLELECVWWHVPVKQYWVLELGAGSSLFWHVAMDVTQLLPVSAVKVGVTLPSAYHSWTANGHAEEFVNRNEWFERRLDQPRELLEGAQSVPVEIKTLGRKGSPSIHWRVPLIDRGERLLVESAPRPTCARLVNLLRSLDGSPIWGPGEVGLKLSGEVAIMAPLEGKPV